MCDDSSQEEESIVLKHFADSFGLSEEIANRMNDCVKELLSLYTRMGELIAED